MAQRFLIVTRDQHGGVFVVGTPSGAVFRSEKSAEKTADKIMDAYPILIGAIAVPVMGFDEDMGIFDPQEV